MTLDPHLRCLLYNAIGQLLNNQKIENKNKKIEFHAKMNRQLGASLNG